MADDIDEATVIAWIDGELEEGEAERVAAQVAVDPDLQAVAERHRRMLARFASAFDPIVREPVEAPASAPVVSLAAVRAKREDIPQRAFRPWYGWGGAIAASLVIGVLIGHQLGSAPGIGDGKGALALAAPVAKALDHQLSGQPGAVRIALSFRDRDNHLCRSFTGNDLSGVACREGGTWQLRYGAPSAATKQADYRMAGMDAAKAEVIDAMIAGDPLDRDAEEEARDSGWGQ